MVETECDAYLTEKWTGERAFQAADTNKDGMIQFEEFVSFSLPLLDATFGRKTNEALQLLKKVCSRERRTLSFTVKVPLFLPHPPYTFQAPTLARHSDCHFYHADDLELPSSITNLPDLLALLRLKLKLVGMSFSAFWQVSEPEKSLDLLASENGSTILITLFDAMAKATAPAAANAAIYIKNIRPKPVQLQEVHHQELQLNCLCPHVHPLGMRWHLDWNSHLIGHGRGPLRLPHNFTIGIGDALVLQLPNEESGIAWKVFMTDDGILSKPLLEQVQVVKGKKKTKAGRCVKQASSGLLTDEQLLSKTQSKHILLQLQLDEILFNYTFVCHNTRTRSTRKVRFQSCIVSYCLVLLGVFITYWSAYYSFWILVTTLFSQVIELIGQVIQTIAAENATAEGLACGETLNSVEVYLEISSDEASHHVAPNFADLAT